MKNIFYKESIKLNRLLISLLIIHIAAVIYVFFRVRVGFVMQEPAFLWLDIMLINGIFYSQLELLIYGSALVIGVMQYYPEFERKRFRLTCHLPVNENKTILTMSTFGVLVVFLLWVIDLIGVFIISNTFFPNEITLAIPLIMFYWLLKAVAIYTFASVVTLEPSWNVKFRLALMLAGFLWIFNMKVYNSNPNYAILALVFTILYTITIYYPALRFRKGL